jgi:hypothetical protein
VQANDDRKRLRDFERRPAVTIQSDGETTVLLLYKFGCKRRVETQAIEPNKSDPPIIFFPATEIKGVSREGSSSLFASKKNKRLDI